MIIPEKELFDKPRRKISGFVKGGSSNREYTDRVNEATSGLILSNNTINIQNFNYNS